MGVVQRPWKEHLPASPGGRLGHPLPSLTPCSVAIPHYILHQKMNTNTNLNISSKSQAESQILSGQKALIQT